ncbi:MAG: hypothetical protein IJY47_01055 [Clostridia bacterium]|nr:hypothetical protein [Clostridia bacterium]
MSYRADMERFQRDYKKKKKIAGLVLKLTVVILAVAILVAGVAVGVMLATGESFAEEETSAARDRKAPVIVGPEGDKAVAYLGDTFAYKSFVTVTDNSGNYTLSVDDSAVNKTAEGSYPVHYTASDAAGNKTEYKLTLIIKRSEYSEAQLMKLVEAKAATLGITKNMTKIQQVRAIYAYVNDPTAGKNDANIYFSDESNTPSQQLSRENWEIDWVEEACRTLSMSRMEGDCYTYYAVSRAFFEYFGIESVGIQRAKDSTEAGTHFWCVVNVGTENAPSWYYYDATRLAGRFSDGTRNGCLMTEAKLKSYVTTAGGTEFYKMNKTDDFPTVSSTEIK